MSSLFSASMIVAIGERCKFHGNGEFSCELCEFFNWYSIWYSSGMNETHPMYPSNYFFWKISTVYLHGSSDSLGYALFEWIYSCWFYGWINPFWISYCLTQYFFIYYLLDIRVWKKNLSHKSKLKINNTFICIKVLLSSIYYSPLGGGSSYSFFLIRHRAASVISPALLRTSCCAWKLSMVSHWDFNALAKASLKSRRSFWLFSDILSSKPWSNIFSSGEMVLFDSSILSRAYSRASALFKSCPQMVSRKIYLSRCSAFFHSPLSHDLNRLSSWYCVNSDGVRLVSNTWVIDT